jgi:hypothetical protein
MNSFSLSLRSVYFFLIYIFFPVVFFSANRRNFWKFQSGKCETNHETFVGNKTAESLGDWRTKKVKSSGEEAFLWELIKLDAENFNISLMVSLKQPLVNENSTVKMENLFEEQKLTFKSFRESHTTHN